MTSYPSNTFTASKSGGGSNQINSYIAVLIVTLFGAFMTLIIIRVIYSNTIVVVHASDAVIYSYTE